MTSVVGPRTFADSSSVSVVVHAAGIWRSHGCRRFPPNCALDNCRKVLDHSRGIGLPVAFIRMLNESAFFNRATPFVRWIEGFESYRNEMGFERASPCHNCEPFTALANQSRGGIVLAGFAGESACLSTLMQANDVHRAVSKISGIYGDVYETADWIAATLPRKLSHGKSASG